MLDRLAQPVDEPVHQRLGLIRHTGAHPVDRQGGLLLPHRRQEGARLLEPAGLGEARAVQPLCPLETRPQTQRFGGVTHRLVVAPGGVVGDCQRAQHSQLWRSPVASSLKSALLRPKGLD